MLSAIVCGIILVIGFVMILTESKPLLESKSIDEIEKWLRFHDELDERYQHKYSNPTILTGYADEIFGDYEKKKKYETGGIRERPREIDPIPFIKKEENKHGGITCKEGAKRMEAINDAIWHRKPYNLSNDDSYKNKQKTNSFNNQFILQSNSDTHKSSYQCVVCGSFNIYEGVAYTDWNIAKKTLTCGDCNNKFSKRSD